MPDAAAEPIQSLTTREDANSQLRDPKKLWGWLRGFAWLFLISKVLSVLGYGALTLRGMAYAPSSVTDLPITLDILALVVLVPGSFLVCVILTLILTYRLAKNLKVLNSSEMDMAPGLATWGYYRSQIWACRCKALLKSGAAPSANSVKTPPLAAPLAGGGRLTSVLTLSPVFRAQSREPRKREAA